MYESFFGLRKRPFVPVPRADCYFPGTSVEAARATLARCIERAEGPGALLGPSGMGKTLLCQVLAEQFRHQLDVVLLSSGRLGNRRSLLQAILHGLGQPYRDMDEGELRLQLVDHLTCADPARGVLLLVDEAHTLPLRCIDELRMVTNLAVDGQARVRLILAGAGLLEERLASPKLDSFSQRLAARCYLEALNRTETEGYIQAQIVWAGGKPARLFPPGACQAVYQATGGVPRLINQVCDHALILACVAGQDRTDAARVQEAWADLQQLPTPWNGQRAQADKAKPAGAAIEFGSLEDESGEPDGAPAHDSSTEVSMDAAASNPAVADLPAGEPVERIEQIEQMLGRLDQEFRPAGTIRPEIELAPDDPTEPFRGDFDEEEVVVERYAPVPEPRQGEGQAPAAGLGADGGEDVSRDGTGPATVPLRRPVRHSDLDAEEPELVVEEDYDFIEQPHTHPVRPVHRHEYRQLFARLRRG